MQVFSSLFLILSLILAVVIGPQTRSWSWGPSLLALAIAVTAGVPEIWRKSRQSANFPLHALGLLLVAWFGWRAWASPVAELGQADLMLLAGGVGAFLSIRCIEGRPAAERIFTWGVAILLGANVAVIAMQHANPSFTPVFGSRNETFPSGFYAHYNEAANYLVGSSLLLAAVALFGPGHGVSRLIWGVIALAGLAAVYFTRSRGGILAAASGMGVFSAGALILGKRSGAKWFSPALIAIPLVGIALGMFLLSGWQESQELRKSGVGISEVMDSNYRLFFLGIALSCIALHPLAGGGGRSFSWECFQFYDVDLQGIAITRKPEQVHNELLQAATDYGLIGAGLLTGFLAALVIVTVVRVIFSEPSGRSSSGDAWRLGGLSALAGMFVQSNFSFVFHLWPGVMLLGICLGQLFRCPPGPRKIAPETGSRIAISFAALGCLLVIVPLGWKGGQVTRLLWATQLGKGPVPGLEAQTEALTTAIAKWPLHSLFEARAMLFHKQSIHESGALAAVAADQAILDYQQAGRLHPFSPETQVNLGNLLSQRQRDEEAEKAFDRAIQLEGGMEPAFQARYSLAKHLLLKGRRQFNPESPEAALTTLETAAEQMERAVKEMRWAAPDLAEGRVSLHENLGAAREANGDYLGALKAYDFAASLINGARVNYRAGLLRSKQGSAAWHDRKPGEALGYFIEAKRRIELAGNLLPAGVEPSQRTQYLAYLARTIAYLQGAKVEPVPP